MTFKEAKDELKKLAGGKYHAIYYELIEHSSGKLTAECRLYIDPSISSSLCHTWEEAFIKLKEILYPPDPIELSTLLSGMPE